MLPTFPGPLDTRRVLLCRHLRLVYDAPLTAPPPQHVASSGTSPPGSCPKRSFASTLSSVPPDSRALPPPGLD
eukprot:2710033-Pyramimonas_sp.AAC.1